MENRNIREKGVANNQISCHSKLVLESSTLAVLASKTMNDMCGRSRIKYGMTSLFNNGGFTLIELLVVVLIIGILGAIALPQYQKAVKKAQYTKMMTWVKKIGEAQTQYYLEKGSYTTSLADLGFAIDASTKKCRAWLSGGPIWKIDDICIGVVNQPNAGVVWGSLGPKYGYHQTDWNGYAYLQTNYRNVPAKQVICMESRNLGKQDPHCTGPRVLGDAHGTFYTLN